MLLSLNNISKSKTMETSPPVHISPDSRSSELERRSRSYDRDLSRSLPLAVSGEVDLSLSSQSPYSALSSRHPSAAFSLHLSWDGERSLSRVCDDLSLEDLRENNQPRIKYRRRKTHPSLNCGLSVDRWFSVTVETVVEEELVRSSLLAFSWFH